MPPANHPIAQRLDALAAWRSALDAQLALWGQALNEHDLLDSADSSILTSLRSRLSSDKLVLAFVAEFSRGKSELINAIFFADSGRRVLPATPGRTTMCPVELRCDAGVAPRLLLLPIESRLKGQSLAELRERPQDWQSLPLDPAQPDSLAEALSAVTRTRQVSVEQAKALGLWSDTQPDDNPPRDSDGRVEVPAWRHALINYPHPLLQQGLVVIDTPGLNAIGAEPELTLGLLPTAHAIVFVLAADAGVTRSDLAIWRDHLSQASLERFVVLNKIDTLADPLLGPAEVHQQIEQQREHSAMTLGVPLQRVFAVSARDALAARVARDHSGLHDSRLAALEQALAAQLLPRRQELLLQATRSVVQQLRLAASRRLADRRRQNAEQAIELRGLRGKSGTKLRLMVGRIDVEMADFEGCAARLAALRSVQARLLRALLAGLSSDALRLEITAMQSALGARHFGLAAKPAFTALIRRLGEALHKAQMQADEMRQMLEASFQPLNSVYGFAFALGPQPSMSNAQTELKLLTQSYSSYLSLGQAWRLAAPGFSEQFVRMLTSKLRVVFENAAGEIELWSRAASSQVDAQLGERRRAFIRRRDALERVQAASGELEQRIAEVQRNEDQAATAQAQIDALAAQALHLAGAPQTPQPAASPARRLLQQSAA